MRPIFLSSFKSLRRYVGEYNYLLKKQRISKKGICSGLSRLLVGCGANITVCPIRKLPFSEARMYMLLSALCHAGFFLRIEEQ